MEMTLTRLINAPQELVWDAWTDPLQLAAWWGPKGFTNPVCEWDAMVGNTLLIHMKAPDGVIYPMNGKFMEVVKPERIVFLSAALDDNGQPLFEIKNTVTFAEEGDKTLITITASVTNLTETGKQYIGGMEQGWSGSFDKLDQYAQDMERSMYIQRLVNAPIERVWEVWTTPDHIKHWWGPNGFTNTIQKMEVKNGGKWEFMMHGADGADYKNEYIYAEVRECKKLVLEHISAPKFVITVTFTPKGTKTLIAIQNMFETKAIKEQLIKQVNAKEGLKQNIDKMEAYLER